MYHATTSSYFEGGAVTPAWSRGMLDVIMEQNMVILV
jgi:hypothetical protein